jgi:glycosyltransferase involved in cell wall biosynthesis
VQDGKSGFVVPSGEAQPIADRILELYNDRELLERLSEGARERIRNDFTVEETARQTMALYRELPNIEHIKRKRPKAAFLCLRTLG